MNTGKWEVDFGSKIFLAMERGGELAATGAAVVGTACPFCQTMFRDAFGTVTETPPKLLDIAQIAAASIESAAGRVMV